MLSKVIFIPRPTRKAEKPKASSMDGGMLAKRYELKYRIPEALALSVRSYIRNYMEPDPYTACRADGRYTIGSLYFDSAQLSLYQETHLDKCNRYKLRMRGYNDDPSSPLFLEIKRKLNRIVYKSRVGISRDSVGEVLSGQVPDNIGAKDRDVLNQFHFYYNQLGARPITLVRYQREAYECGDESRVRITFDYDIQCRAVKGADFRLNCNGWQSLPINFVVLEIKFTERYPQWIHQMVRHFNLNRQSMSKYCASVHHIASYGLLHPYGLIH